MIFKDIVKALNNQQQIPIISGAVAKTF